MYKKTVTYTDFNGVERTEDFYFNLTNQELTEMELEVEGGLTSILDKIIKAQNVPDLVKYFKIILKKAYGVKSEDGRKFMKNEAIWEDFESTQAFSDIYMEFAMDDEAASAFVNGIMPPEGKEAIAEAQKNGDIPKVVPKEEK